VAGRPARRRRQAPAAATPSISPAPAPGVPARELAVAFSRPAPGASCALPADLADPLGDVRAEWYARVAGHRGLHHRDRGARGGAVARTRQAGQPVPSPNHGPGALRSPGKSGARVAAFGGKSKQNASNVLNLSWHLPPSAAWNHLFLRPLDRPSLMFRAREDGSRCRLPQHRNLFWNAG
jgi:hypothetical protein